MADSLEAKRKLVKQQMIKNHLTQQAIEENDVNVAPEIGAGESALRGAAQGASFGFGDELTGAFQGGLEAASQYGNMLRNTLGMDDQESDFSKVGETYTKARNENREANKLAQDANPKSYLAGNVVGGIATAPILGEFAAGVKGAAALGGLAGLGTSDVDLTKPIDTEKALELGKEVGTGAVLGGGIAAVPALAKGAGNMIAETTPGKAFLRGVKGETINPSTFGETTGAARTEFSKKTLKDIQELEEAAAKVKSTRLKDSTAPIETQKARKTIEQGIDEISGTGVGEEKALQDVGGAFGDRTHQALQNVKRTGTDITEVPLSPSSRAKLEAEIAKEKVTAEALGQNIRHEIKESVGPDGKKYLTKITSSDETAAGAEKAIPMLDSEGKPTGEYNLSRSGEPMKTTAAAKTVEDIPASGGYKVFSPTEEEEIKKVVIKIRNNNPITPQEAELLNTKLEAIKGGYKDIKPITSAINRGQSEITGELNKIPEINAINKDIRSLNASRESIGASSDFGKNPIDFAGQDPRQYQLARTIESASGGGTSGAVPSDKLKQLVGNLKEVDPLMAEKLEQQIATHVENAEITGAIDPSVNYSRAGLLKQALTKGANPLGRYIGRPAAAVGKALDLGGATSSALEKAGITATINRAEDTRGAETSKYNNPMSKMNPDQLREVAARLRGRSGMEGVAKKVEQAAQTGSPLDKAQAEFVIQQSPNAKKALENPNE